MYKCDSKIILHRHDVWKYELSLVSRNSFFFLKHLRQQLSQVYQTTFLEYRINRQIHVAFFKLFKLK